MVLVVGKVYHFFDANPKRLHNDMSPVTIIIRYISSVSDVYTTCQLSEELLLIILIE